MSVNASGSSIIVALDGSTTDRLVLAQARAMVKAFGGSLLLVGSAHTGVAPTTRDADAGEPPAAMAPIGAAGVGGMVATPAPIAPGTEPQFVEDTDATGSLNILSNELATAGMQVEVIEASDDLAATISHEARRRNAAMVIMARPRSEGGLGRLFFGSSFDTLLRDISCPVLLIPSDN